MSRHRRRFNSFYSRLIRITLWVIGTMSLYFFAFSVVLYSSFETIVTKANQKILNLTVLLIEEELQRYNDLTWTIAMQPDIQENLNVLRDPGVKTAWSRAWDSISATLIQHDPSNWYVSSIRILDSTGEEFMVGRDPYNLSESDWELIRIAAKATEGRVNYLNPGDVNDYLIIFREIRTTKDLALNHLGIVAVFIDIPALVQFHERLVEDFHIDIRIFRGDTPIDGRVESIDFNDFVKADRPILRQPSVRIDGARYIIAESRSTNTEWTYVSTIPVSFLYSRLIVMVVIGLAVYAVLTALVVRLAMSIDKKLTVPIAELSRELMKVESGNFDVNLSPEQLDDPTDEIHQLYGDLNISFNKIKELITQDYLKRIELQDAQFRILQSQINPHFLYNTLDTMLWMAKAGNDETIIRIVKSLGRLLRKSLSCGDPLVAVADEVVLLEDYLTIQNTRFADRLEVNIEIPDKMAGCSIPPFTFQPFVENAIHYALEEGEGHCRIQVSGRLVGEYLEFTITDNGPGFTTAQIGDFNIRGHLDSRGSGIGIINIRDRLTVLLENVDFRIGRSEAGGAMVLFSYAAVECAE